MTISDHIRELEIGRDIHLNTREALRLLAARVEALDKRQPELRISVGDVRPGLGTGSVAIDAPAASGGPKQESSTAHYPLFEHMSRAHGLTLLDSEMDEIVRVVQKMTQPAAPLTGHAGDCSIYSAMINCKPCDGICTCGYGAQQWCLGDYSKLYSTEREEKRELIEDQTPAAPERQEQVTQEEWGVVNLAIASLDAQTRMELARRLEPEPAAQHPAQWREAALLVDRWRADATELRLKHPTSDRYLAKEDVLRQCADQLAALLPPEKEPKS